ncbi:hypothetical protein IP90_00970 [Luteimonas cucumeris]|uniref:Uncharacterized protein n=1 Tax=Luteimonas cucumeris TaxID=985012 RepID=A0A562LAY5_9GAMM|nr:hypothetical protein [Luteimonas cucumeris]TWI04832.1 hypothetical protein IP90_00970 [Luteimonas cucumeris]
MVRAKYPEAKLLHGTEGGKEIGRIPTDPANWVTVDAVKFGEMANLGDAMNPRRRAPK